MSTPDKVDTDMIIKNKNYETDLKYDLELNRIFLKIIGIWPADPRHLTTFDRVVALVARFVTIFSLLFVVIPTGCYALFTTTDWSLSIQLLATVLYCIEAILKFGIVIARNDEIKRCIDTIVADWRDVDWKVHRTIMLDNARSCRVFAICFATANYGSITTFHSIATFEFIRSYHSRSNATASAPVIYGAEFFIFDARVSPICELTYVGQNLGGIAMVTVNCAICMMIVKFVMHACSRYRMVITLAQSANDAENDDDDNDLKGQDDKGRKFGHVVQRHLDAIEFVRRIENALNEICFVSLALSTIDMCFLGYTLIMEWEESAPAIATYICAVMSLILNIFILCYCGEQLAEQCRQLSLAGYMTNWWSMQPHESRALVLMTAMAQLPVEFTAGKFVDLTLKTFVAVMKISMSYLNFLRTTIQLHG